MPTLIQRAEEMLPKEKLAENSDQNVIVFYAGFNQAISEIKAEYLPKVFAMVREEIKKKRWQQDTVCTHYQDNCSCRSDKDVKKHNDILEDILQLLK